MTTCLICERDLPPMRPGRRRIYCSSACKSLADAEAKRVRGLMQYAEHEMATHRELIAGVRRTGCWPCARSGDLAGHLAHFEAEMRTYEDRLRAVRGGSLPTGGTDHD